MKLIFIRHGETDSNIEKRYAGSYESQLTAVGKRQGEKAAAYIKAHYEANAIFVSERERAQYIAKRISINYSVEERLNEYQFGIFENMTYDEIMAIYPRAYQNWMDDRHYKIEAGESKADFEARIEGFLESVRFIEKGNIVCVTHSGVIQTAIVKLLDLPPESKWRFAIPNGGIAVIEIQGDYARLIKLGEIEGDE